MKALIKCVGFIGDNLFASSIPRKLKQQGFTKVDLQLSIAQPYELLNFNPDIDEVFLYQPNPNTYDEVYYLNPIHRKRYSYRAVSETMWDIKPISGICYIYEPIYRFICRPSVKKCCTR
jgi:hypothetical protein